VPATVERYELVRRIHATPTMVVLAVTGGGVATIADLLAVPGASRTVLEASVPYAATALADLLGGPPAQATSSDTAAAMARACRLRAELLRPDPSVAVAGVACTGGAQHNGQPMSYSLRVFIFARRLAISAWNCSSVNDTE